MYSTRTYEGNSDREKRLIEGSKALKATKEMKDSKLVSRATLEKKTLKYGKEGFYEV